MIRKKFLFVSFLAVFYTNLVHATDAYYVRLKELTAKTDLDLLTPKGEVIPYLKFSEYDVPLLPKPETRALKMAKDKGVPVKSDWVYIPAKKQTEKEVILSIRFLELDTASKNEHYGPYEIRVPKNQRSKLFEFDDFKGTVVLKKRTVTNLRMFERKAEAQNREILIAHDLYRFYLRFPFRTDWVENVSELRAQRKEYLSELHELMEEIVAVKTVLPETSLLNKFNKYLRGFSKAEFRLPGGHREPVLPEWQKMLFKTK